MCRSTRCLARNGDLSPRFRCSAGLRGHAPRGSVVVRPDSEDAPHGCVVADSETCLSAGGPRGSADLRDWGQHRFQTHFIDISYRFRTDLVQISHTFHREASSFPEFGPRFSKCSAREPDSGPGFQGRSWRERDSRPPQKSV